MAHKTRIMYIEQKTGEGADGISGPARIGRVTFSKSGKSLYYRGRTLKTLAGRGFKANYFDVDTGEEFWISGCKKKGGDRLYAGIVEIDKDAAEEYWVKIRNQPERKDELTIRCAGKHGK